MSKSNPQEFLKDGLLIAGCTAYVHIVAYAWEYGFCKFFSIPTFFIQLNATSVISTALLLMFALFMTFMLADILVSNIFPRARASQKLAIAAAVIWLVFTILILQNGQWGVALSVVVFLLIFCMAYVTIYIGQILLYLITKKDSWRFKLRRIFSISKRRRNSSVLAPNFRYFRTEYIRGRLVPSLTLITAILIVMNAFLLSREYAREVQPLLFSYKGTEYGLVANYGDKFFGIRLGTKDSPEPLSLLVLNKDEMVGLLLESENGNQLPGTKIAETKCVVDGCFTNFEFLEDIRINSPFLSKLKGNPHDN